MPSPIATRPLTALSIDEARQMAAFVHPGAEAQRLEKILTPASPAEVAQALGFLFKVLPMENAGETEAEKDEIADANLAAYGEALRGYPRWVIIEARSAFIAGLVKGFNGRFAPKPPEFGRECAARVDAYREKLGRMRKMADERRHLDEEEYTGPRTPALKAFGDRRAAELRAAAEADRQKHFGRGRTEWVDPNPITPEAMAAADIPDAPTRDGALAKAPTSDAFEKIRRTA